MHDLFDGFANIRKYERAAFVPRQCELIAYEDFGKYTLTRLLFEGRDTYMFLIKASVSVEPAPNGTFAHFISSGAYLTFSVGGLAYISNSKAVQLSTSTESLKNFAGFDGFGKLRLIPDGCLAAVESGIVHGAEASPFLVLNGKRLAINDNAMRSRDRLLLAQLKTGEPAFIFIKGVDITRAADYAFQLGCSHAAVISNERRIDIYGKSIIQDRQAGCRAVFVIH